MPNNSVMSFVKGQAAAFLYADKVLKEVRAGKRTLDSAITEIEARRDDRLKRFHEMNAAG